MVTAWSPSRMDRDRFAAGPWLRVLSLAVLLFGVLVTHGGHAESVRGHLSASAAAPAALSGDDVRHAAVEPAPPPSATEADDRNAPHEPSHPGEQCVSGQPQQGSVLVPLCFAASVRESLNAVDTSIVPVSAGGRPIGVASPAALRAASVVQQV
ncbi:hypothetical protein EF907_16300 [Streptomyces sp. WAC06273]|nr:hypothetical protein EF907_16300 [Streptomyces sp. WAC06273]